MRTLLGCVVAVVLTGAGAAADSPEKIDGKKLVGRWAPADAKKEIRLTVEFARDGKINIICAGGKKEFKAEGTYKLQGDQLTMTFKIGDSDVTETVTITKLDDRVLEGKNQKGRAESFTRVRAE